MIQDAQVLIQQIDVLTKQNNLLVNELIDVKKKLQQLQQGGQGTSPNGGGQGGRNADGADGRDGAATQGGPSRQSNGSGSSGGANAQSGQNAQGQNGAQSQSAQNQAGASNPTRPLADQLKQLKGMVQSLETQMSGYVSMQTGSKLTPPDVVNLLLTVMDGMIDWSVDFVENASSQDASAQQQGQNQNQGQAQVH